MVAPLPPTKIDQALKRGTQQELDEFQRLVEASLLAELEPLKALTVNQEARLKELGQKLFGSP